MKFQAAYLYIVEDCFLCAGGMAAGIADGCFKTGALICQVQPGNPENNRTSGIYNTIDRFAISVCSNLYLTIVQAKRNMSRSKRPTAVKSIGF